MAIRSALLTPSEGRFSAALRRTRAALARRRAALDADAARRAYPEFFDRYCDLVELISDAANIGIEAWMEEAYPARARAFADAYHRVERQVGSAEFEALFAAESLTALLAGDDGALWMRMDRTQTALERWQRSLEVSR